MPPLDPKAALSALADVDVELAVDGLARDLDLELLGDVGLVERAAAVGAALKQRRLVNLVDLFGAGRPALGFGPVALAGLAAGLLGLGRGRPGACRRGSSRRVDGEAARSRLVGR